MFRITGVLMVILLIYQLVAQARVATGITPRDEESPTYERTMFNIVWGCVSTTIICAWAAIHPNIPPREGPFKRALRRIEFMFWTIVAPEILPCWAMNQLLAAITVRDVYNKGKGYEVKRCGFWETLKAWFSLYEITEDAGPAWTVAHGHFLIMGGFQIVEPPGALLVDEVNAETEKQHRSAEDNRNPEESRVTILTLEMLRELVKDREFKIQISEEEISNRSKGDALSKLIFIIQSTWFILQCVGRRVQGLNLTQLELTTLALASLNGVTFALWWDKPLGAQTVAPVYLKRKLTDSERKPLEGVRDRSARSETIPWMKDTFEECSTTIRDAFRCHSDGLFRPPFAIILLLLLPIISFAFAFLATVFDLLESTSSSFPPDDKHVPTFYVPKHRYPKWFHIFLLVTLAVAFGGIHCSGWNFSFSTYTEQKLWRVASLAVTIIPIATFPIAVISYTEPRFPRSVETFANNTVVVILILCALAYVSARLVLLGLALSLLTHLPPTAFIAIDWTRFYPHIL